VEGHVEYETVTLNSVMIIILHTPIWIYPVWKRLVSNVTTLSQKVIQPLGETVRYFVIPVQQTSDYT